MPLDVLRSFDGIAPDGLEIAQAAARGAELSLMRRVMPDEDWSEAGAPDVVFDAAREAFREAHAWAVRMADEAEFEDPDAWPEEPLED